MEEQERKRKGDVYREIKVGAEFPASQGPERSQLAPGVFVDQAGQKHYVARREPCRRRGLAALYPGGPTRAASSAATGGSG